MADEYEDNPYRTPQSRGSRQRQSAAPADDDEDLLTWVMEPLRRSWGWVMFIGILLVIQGSLTCITIIGAVYGWLPLWNGITLIQAATKLRDGVDRGDPELMHEGADKLRLGIKLFGITIIVGVTLVIAMYALMFIVIIAGASAQGNW